MRIAQLNCEIESSEEAGGDAGWRRLWKAVVSADTFTSIGLWCHISVYSREQIKYNTASNFIPGFLLHFLAT